MAAERIYWKYDIIKEKCAELRANKSQFESIREEINAIIRQLETGFLSQTQKAAEAAHLSYQGDFDRFVQILEALPKVAEEGMEYTKARDLEMANRVVEIMSLVRM